MKTRVFILLVMLCFLGYVNAQKKGSQKQPSQAEMNKMLEEAMQAEGMSKEEQAEMKKMMGSIMPALEKHNETVADYPEFTSNARLIPERDEAKIAALNKKALTKAEVTAYATSLYNKLIAKADASEAGLIKKIIAQSPKANELSGASILAMMQGHAEAALALSMKAVAADPANLNLQNNMAALLTQYGFADKALPILLKLNKELSDNSTLFNNLANAWLNLGEADSALFYADAAMAINPHHPEAAQIAGVVRESKGANPSGNYIQAMENAPNPLTKSLLKNSGNRGDIKWSTRVFDNITVYEFFGRRWMGLPELSNSVRGFEDDMSIKNAYLDAVKIIGERITLMTDSTEKALDALVDKGETEFVAEMAAATVEGLSWMSKPAANVMEVLHAYQTQFQFDFADSMKTIETWKLNLRKEKDAKIKAIYDKIDSRKQTNCEQFKHELDNLENRYLETVNARLENYFLRHVNRYRRWLNALITWNWYVAGNPKNIIMLQNLKATEHLVNVYAGVADQLEALPEHCGVATTKKVTQPPVPIIPNFTCPVVVSIPTGEEWQQFTAKAKDFNKNKYQMKKTPNPVPNVSVAYGIGKQVAQPGHTPFIKTVNGSIMPGAFNSQLNGNSAAQNITSNTPAPPTASELVRNQMARELLTKMQNGRCLSINPERENLLRELRMMELSMELSKQIRAGERAIKEREMNEAALKNEINQAKTEVQQNGLQPSISSGLQAPGTTSLPKNLFQ